MQMVVCVCGAFNKTNLLYISSVRRRVEFNDPIKLSFGQLRSDERGHIHSKMVEERERKVDTENFVELFESIYPALTR